MSHHLHQHKDIEIRKHNTKGKKSKKKCKNYYQSIINLEYHVQFTYEQTKNIKHPL